MIDFERVLVSIEKRWHKISRYGKSLHRVEQTERRRLAALLRTRTSENCILYGSGPSINSIDTTALKNCDSFFVNGTARHEQFDAHENKYVVVSGGSVHGILDHEVGRKYVDDYLCIAKGHPVITLIGDRPFYFDNVDRNIENSFFVKPGLNSHSDIRLVPSLRMGVYSSNNVIGMALQVAFLFGYQTVYLVGFDGTIVVDAIVGKQFRYGVASEEYMKALHSKSYRISEVVIAWGKIFQECVWLNIVFEACGRKVVNLSADSVFDMFKQPN